MLLNNEEQAILEAYRLIRKENSIWSQNNLERKLREIDLISGLSSRDKRRNLVRRLVKLGYDIEDFDTHSGLDPAPYRGERLFQNRYSLSLF